VETLKRNIDELRARADSLQSLYAHDRRIFEEDPNLSDIGRREKLDSLKSEITRGLRTLMDEENRLIDEEIVRVERRIHSARGSQTVDLIAARDADERASRLSNADEAAPMLHRALRSDDTVLAVAVARRGVDEGWYSVVRMLEGERPELAKPFKELSKLIQLRDQFLRVMHYAPPAS